MAQIAPHRCMTCGAALLSGQRWYSIHDGRRALRACRECLEDALGRADAEARYQLELLEATWQLPSRQTGAVDSDGEAGVP
jgi:hypothetical protein